MQGLRDRLSYANVVATLALFLAIGGGAYAVSRIGPKEIKRNAVKSRHLAPNAAKGRDVKESSLGTVPDAARLGGRPLGEIVRRIDFKGAGGATSDTETQTIGAVELTYHCTAAGGNGELAIEGERRQNVSIPYDSSHTLGNGPSTTILHKAGSLAPSDQLFFEDSSGSVDRGTFWIVWREPTRTVSIQGSYTVTLLAQANCDLNAVATIAPV